jgi:hypothetical protein
MDSARVLIQIKDVVALNLGQAEAYLTVREVMV